MVDSETIYVEKKIICKKCGHIHEFNIRTNLSISNFTFNAICVECGGRIVIDMDSIFKGGKVPEQISSIQDPYLNVDASAVPTNTSSNVPLDLDTVEDIEEKTSSEGQNATPVLEDTEPMPDVSSFFEDIEEK